MPEIGVILAAHNPDMRRLGLVLDSLAAQTRPPTTWTLIIVDNGSRIPIVNAIQKAKQPIQIHWVNEPHLGLLRARIAGLKVTLAPLVIFVDDDNVLDPNYLEIVAHEFSNDPNLGNLAGRIRPYFETPPPEWLDEFRDLLALRDPGDVPLVARDLSHGYPGFAFGGGGAAFRRLALMEALSFMANIDGPPVIGRTGDALDSGEDNDIVLSILAAGWSVAYSPNLKLTHLIPAGRTTEQYLGRLNEAIRRSWVKVLSRHHIRPWPAISPWTVPLRKAKAYVSYRAWRGGQHYVRWRGACGQFEGQATLT